ncbi:MAG: AGE family epimerase/isomerase [Phycisphaeraceae bacterium]
MERELWNRLLPRWFAHGVDAGGGFHPVLGPDWTRQPDNRRSVVYQARMTWAAAEAAQACTDRKQRDAHAGHARHGADYLLRAFHDAPQGGYFWVIDGDAGAPTAALGWDKHVYGQAFVVYALANVHGATGEQRYLDAAIELFHWLETHAHDKAHGGYREQLQRDGRQRETGDRLENRSTFAPATPAGFKTANTHLHVIEAWTVLAAHWRDDRVQARLAELVELARDRMIVPPGCMHGLFTSDWRAVPMHDSFGHDVEMAVLLLDAAAVVGRGEDATLQRLARSLVDHALAVGFDQRRGGLASTGEALGTPCHRQRHWWVQAEMLQALARMHALHGQADDRYRAALALQWQFVRDCIVDHRHGGWHETVDERGRLRSGQRKAHAWKAAYHETRALLNASRWLRCEASTPACQIQCMEGSKS